MTTFFKPDPASGLALVRQFQDQLAARIDKGQLKPGARLPSVRQQACEAGVSTMTVTNAYARLVAEGYIEARPGSGYYVASGAAQAQPRRKPFVGRTSVDSLWLLQRVYEDDSTLLNAGCGWIRPDWLHIDGVRQALASLARKNAAGLANYGTPQGYLPLRQHIESMLAQRAIEAPPHQIVLTHGASQALAMAARALLQPREIALVDSPGSTNFFATLRALDIKPVGVERRVDGPDIQALEALAQRHRPKAFFTTLHLHNPTGSSCSPTVAYQILRLAEQYGFHVVENDVMAGLEPPGLPSLASLGQLQRVIYIGSFAKTISPALRVGFAAASEDMAEKLVYQKMVSSLTSSELTEKIAHAALVDGSCRAHVGRLAQRLAQAQRETCDGLEQAGMKLFTRPAGGPFLWAGFPRDTDVRKVAQDAVAAGILLAPGLLFHPEQKPLPWLRLNVCYANHPALFDFLARQVGG